MWLSIISIALRLVGLAEWYENWRKQRYSQKLMQSLADTPTTNEEWNDDAKNGDL